MANFLQVPICFIFHFLLCIFTSLPSAASSIPKASAPSLRTRARVDRIWANQIRCIGTVPKYLRGGFSPEGEPIEWDTPRRLCAKTWYGGRPNANYGGYCAKKGTQASQLYFEPTSTTGSFRLLRPTRLPGLPVEADIYDQFTLHQVGQSFCQLRCRCLAQDDRTDGPWPAEEIVASEPGTDVLSYDVNPVREPVLSIDLRITRLDRESRGGTNGIYTVIVPEESNTLNDVQVQILPFRSLPRWFPPKCADILPSRYPPPFAPGSFESAKEFCSSPFHGGSKLGSAGFVCAADPNDPRGLRRLTVIEHLTHPSLLAENSLGLYAHYWCRSICKCHYDEPKGQIPITVNGVDENSGIDMIVKFVDGKIFVAPKDGSAPEHEMDLVKDWEGSSGPSKVSADLATIQQAAEDITFTVPLERPLSIAQFGQNPNRGGSNFQGQCGGICNGPGQCGGGCICALDPMLAPQVDTYGHGLGWAGYATCTGIAMTSRGRNFRVTGLGKRDLRELECPCNETVAASECCEWPDVDQGRGVLRLASGLDV